MGESQYCQGSTPVLSKEYYSTFRGVLQYFHGSTGTMTFPDITRRFFFL